MGILKDFMNVKDIQPIEDAYASCCYVFTEDELIELCKIITKEQRKLCSENPSDGLSEKQYNDVLNSPEPDFL